MSAKSKQDILKEINRITGCSEDEANEVYTLVKSI